MSSRGPTAECPGTSASASFAGLGAIVLWSCTIALVRSLSEAVGPLTGAAAVYLVAGGICVAHLGLAGSITRRLRALPRAYLLGCGALSLSYMLLIFLAISWARDRHQVLEVGLVNYLWPALTILFSLTILKRRANPLLLVPGTFVALAGVFTVMTQGGEFSWGSFAANMTGNPAAYALALGAAVSWALYSNLARRWGGTQGGGGVVFFMPATAILFLLLRLVVNEGGTWEVRSVVEAVVLGTSTVAAYELWDVAMRKGNTTLVAAASYATPFLSTLVSCLYLGALAAARLWLGCALIVTGAVLSWLATREPATDAPDPAQPTSRGPA